MWRLIFLRSQHIQSLHLKFSVTDGCEDHYFRPIKLFKTIARPPCLGSRPTVWQLQSEFGMRTIIKYD